MLREYLTGYTTLRKTFAQVIKVHSLKYFCRLLDDIRFPSDAICREAFKLLILTPTKWCFGPWRPPAFSRHLLVSSCCLQHPHGAALTYPNPLRFFPAPGLLEIATATSILAMYGVSDDLRTGYPLTRTPRPGSLKARAVSSSDYTVIGIVLGGTGLLVLLGLLVHLVWRQKHAPLVVSPIYCGCITFSLENNKGFAKCLQLNIQCRDK